MYDILNNYAFGYFQQATADAAGAAANAPNDNGIDLWDKVQLPNRVLLIVDVGGVGSSGTLDLIVQDSSDRSIWDVDFSTIAQITEAGLYLVEIFDPMRYIRLNVDVTTDTVVWSGLYMTFENQRRPVSQIGTVLIPTYGTGRTPKLGGAIS